MPASLWSGNLRLSLVIIPVKMHSAVSTEDAISFRMIHEPTGKPIKYVKGVIDGDEFIEVPEEEIVKGYEHAKGHHVLIHPEELDVPMVQKFPLSGLLPVVKCQDIRIVRIVPLVRCWSQDEFEQQG